MVIVLDTVDILFRAFLVVDATESFNEGKSDGAENVGIGISFPPRPHHSRPQLQIGGSAQAEAVAWMVYLTGKRNGIVALRVDGS